MSIFLLLHCVKPDVEGDFVPQQTYALVISTITWEDESLRPFDPAVRQDRHFLKVLQRAGIPPDHIVYLEDRDATLFNIRTFLQATLARTPADGTFLFYFQGHGEPDGALMNYDAVSDDRTSLFFISDLTGALQSFFHGRTALLFADSCYSGLLRETVASLADETSIRALSFSSTTHEHTSTEHWTFTSALSEIFSGQKDIDLNRDGRIDLDEAQTHIEKRMLREEEQQPSAARSRYFPADFSFKVTDQMAR